MNNNGGSGDGRVIYRHADILAGPNLDYIEGGYLVTEEDKITELGPPPGPKEGIDLFGCLIIPGFVDAHVHLGDSVCKDAGTGMPTIYAVSPPDGLKYRELAKLDNTALTEVLASAVRELISTGITAFCDFREGGAEGASALREVLKTIPVRGLIIGEPAWSDETSVTSNYLTAIDGLLPFVDGIGIGDIADFRHKELQGLSEKSLRFRKKIAVHAAETEDAQKRCRELWGVTEIERVHRYKADMLVHVTNPTDIELDIIAEGKLPVVICPRTNAILADGVPPLERLFEMDIPLGLGTDNMMFTNPNMFREMDFASRLARLTSKKADCVSSRRILQAATIGGASVLGLSGELGSLEAGKKAHFIVIDLNTRNLKAVRDPYSALVHRAGVGDIRFVVVSGKNQFDHEASS